MSNRTTVAVGLLLFGTVVFFGVGLKARMPDGYTVSTVDVPNSTRTEANGIDILGRIVGSYADGSGTHGFIFSKGEFSTLDYPGAPSTAAYGINAAGQIVGTFGPNGSNGRHGFLLSNGRYSSIDVPGSSDTVARGINSHGQIVGDYAGADGARHGFLLSAGTYNTVEVPKTEAGAASGINDSGQIVGRAGAGATASGFVFAGGQFGRVQVPESNYTEAWGLNNRGDVVGQSGGPEPPSRGFKFANGAYITLELPSLPSSWDARGISDLGEIVGTFTDNDGKTHGYRATPAALQEGPVDSRLSEVLGGGGGAELSSDGSGRPGRSGGAAGSNGTRERGSEASSRASQTPMLLALATVISNLENASATLGRAQNQSACVKTTISEIGATVRAVNDVIRLADSNGVSDAPVARLVKAAPDFSPPPQRYRESSETLYRALASLRVAFEKLSQTSGGDFDGIRAALSDGIAGAADTLRPCIIEGNKVFEARRAQDGRGGRARSTGNQEALRAVGSGLSSLENAVASLRRATNQRECVKATALKIDAAIGSAREIVRFVDAGSANEVAPGKAAGGGPDFTAPPRVPANASANLYSALDSLRTAFERLGQAGGGDWGGLRGKVNGDIAAAAGILRPCIVEGNNTFDERHSGDGDRPGALPGALGPGRRN